MNGKACARLLGWSLMVFQLVPLECEMNNNVSRFSWLTLFDIRLRSPLYGSSALPPLVPKRTGSFFTSDTGSAETRPPGGLCRGMLVNTEGNEYGWREHAMCFRKSDGMGLCGVLRSEHIAYLNGGIPCMIFHSPLKFQFSYLQDDTQLSRANPDDRRRSW